jgi:hypothetical protein
MRKKPPYVGTGYINTKKPVFKAVYDYIWSLTANFLPTALKSDRKLYHRFISHIHVSMLALNRKQLKDPAILNSVPIYCRLKDDHFGRNFNWEILRDAGIIKVKPHNSLKHKSNEYRLTSSIFNRILEITAQCIIDFFDVKGMYFVNLFSGKRISVQKSQFYRRVNGEKDFNIPSLIKQSMKSFKPCPLDLETGLRWFKKVKDKYDYEAREFKRETRGLPKYTANYKRLEKEYQSHKGKYLNELSCLETIIVQIVKIEGVTKKDRPIYYVMTAYIVQKNGRVSEIHGGFQSISTMMKHLLLRDIPGIWNYDLKTSQGFILLDEMEKYDIKCPWLENYLNDPKAKTTYAKKIGIPEEVWKNCFYAIVMGANAENRSSSIFKTIKNYCKNEKKTEDTYKLFLKVARGLVKPTNKWRNAIFYSPLPEHHSIRKGVLRWKNACGLIYRDSYLKSKLRPYDTLITDGKEIEKNKTSECKRKIAAYILQGREAYFIHFLTVLCSKNDIPVFKNEHDGVITSKEILKPLIRRTKQATGLHQTDLEFKELCTERKRIERKRYVDTR